MRRICAWGATGSQEPQISGLALQSQRSGEPRQGTVSQVAEKNKNGVIPSAARDPSWFNCY